MDRRGDFQGAVQRDDVLTDQESAVWASVIPDEEWEIYKLGIDTARACNVQFLIGGAFGLAGYTGRWRNTKDLDFFVYPKDKDALIECLHRAGFVDYYGRQAYDRSWIYRATKNCVLVDVIWTLPNHRAVVDETWFAHARPITLRDEELFLIPAEELLWIKLYVMQRDRCDWPDVINLLHATGPELNWDHLLGRMAQDEPLLKAAVLVFNWISPQRAAQLPAKIRERFNLPTVESESNPEVERDRVKLLDSRPWFAAYQPQNQPMQL